MSARATSLHVRLRALFGAALLALFVLLPTAALAAPIRLWHAYRGDEQKALEAIIEKSGADVELLALPYDAFGSKLAASIPLGDGPDLFIDTHERLGDYRARKIVAPVGDALESEQAFLPAALAAVHAEGKVWGLPLSPKCMALYVNTDLVSVVPPDIEGIADLKSTLPKDVFPLAYEAMGAYAHAPFLAAFGGELLDASDQFAFVGPKAAASLEFTRGLIERGVVPEDSDGSLVTSLFKGGKAAFAISGPWLAAELGAETSLHYRVVSLPKVRATGELLRPLITVESLIFSPKGAARSEARALGRFIAGPEAAKIRAELGRTVTARADVAMPEGDTLLQAFAEQAKVAIPMPASQAMRAVWEPANRAIAKVMRGDASAEDALIEAKHRFDDVRRPLPEKASPTPILLVVGILLLLAALSLVRKAKDETVRAEIKRSLPAYRYVAHAVIAIFVLVMAPLLVGAATSLFAGSTDDVRYVGLANFINILTARGGPLLASGSFYLVLIVTVVWTLLNLAFHLGIGVALGLLLARPVMRLRAVYRVLLILPWAVPSYVTALAWKGMFHKQYGAVTGLLLAINDLIGTDMKPIAWFSNFSTSFSANLATNVWLGFPFMMVVTIGALTSVSEDVLEAAEVDGATRFQRLRLVTLPMIRPVLAPAVTLGAIWTFNMFNVVFLVSGGAPDGTTDILVSEAYRWAFTREAQYGYAAAYSVLIFLLLTGATRFAAYRRDRLEKAAVLVQSPTGSAA